MNRMAIYLGITLFLTLASCSNSGPKAETKKRPKQELTKKQDDYSKYAPEIQQQLHYLDSVYDLGLFYFRYKAALYFIAVDGSFSEPKDGKFVKKGSYKMGLLGQNMDTLLGFEYDRIGNLNAVAEGCVELEKDGKFGLYHIKGKVLIKPIYDAIYPVVEASDRRYTAKLKKGAKFGILYIDYQDSVHTYFAPNETYTSERYFQSPYITGESDFWQFSIEKTKVEPLFNLHAEFYDGHAEYSRVILVTPSYLVQAGLLNEFYEGLMIDEEVDFGMDVFEAKQLNREKNNGVVARIVNFMQRFSESRGEIQQEDRLITNGSDGKMLNNVLLFEGYMQNRNCQNKSYRFLDSGLLETKVSLDTKGGPYDEMDVRSYYKIDKKGKINKLSSARRFPMTDFIWLDSSDFYGCFVRIIRDTSSKDHLDKGRRLAHLTTQDLTYMMMEIYADHGMIPPLEAYKDTFTRLGMNVYMKADETLLPAREVYNLNVIKRQLERMKGRENDFIKEEIFEIIYAG